MSDNPKRPTSRQTYTIGRCLADLAGNRHERRRRLHHPSAAEARLAAILAGDDALVVVDAPASIITFKAACDEWLRYVEHDKRRAKSTVRDYRNAVRCYLLGAFGEATPVANVTTLDVDSFRDDLLAGHLSRRTVQKVLVILHGIFARAKRKGWIASNPATDAERVTITTPGTFNVLDPEQVAAISRHAATDTLAALFTVGAFTGLRCPGELRALRWGHVDFANRIVHVQRNYVLGEEGITKGKRVRSVPLSDQALVALDGLSRARPLHCARRSRVLRRGGRLPLWRHDS